MCWAATSTHLDSSFLEANASVRLSQSPKIYQRLLAPSPRQLTSALEKYEWIIYDNTKCWLIYPLELCLTFKTSVFSRRSKSSADVNWGSNTEDNGTMQIYTSWRSGPIARVFIKLQCNLSKSLLQQIKERIVCSDTVSEIRSRGDYVQIHLANMLVLFFWCPMMLRVRWFNVLHWVGCSKDWDLDA